MKFKRVPQFVDAMQFLRGTYDELEKFTNYKVSNHTTEKCMNGKSYCDLETYTGIRHNIVEGSYIGRNDNGDFTIYDQQMFERMYIHALDAKTEPIDAINNEIRTLKASGTIKSKDVSDTYHTFGELYNHRMALTAALCHTINNVHYTHEVYCYKSWKHSDGTMFDGMFIVVIESPHGQMAYHYNAEHWDKFQIREVPTALVYDGHTADDVIERLLKLYLDRDATTATATAEEQN